MEGQRARALDKFYTQRAEAARCVRRAAAVCDALGIDRAAVPIVEPSAGSGAFLDVAPFFGGPVHGFDLAPESHRVARADYLSLDTLRAVKVGPGKALFLGNPPFGKRGRLALDFLNKTLGEGTATAFVLPLVFRKWITQRAVREDAALVADFPMPHEAFELMGKPYAVRCCFQVWTTRPLAGTGLEDLRTRKALPIAHPDFEIWQYNATPVAEKVFDEDWDFAVLRQGYGPYTIIDAPAPNLSRKKQWALFKAHTPEALARLKAIDFDALAQTNTAVKGFGKGEVVHHYRSRFEGLKEHPQTARLDASANAL